MFKYPYGDSQQLNLDWILRKLKELEEEVVQQITEDLEVISNALISATFSSSNAYNRSDIVYHDGKLYRANVNIPAPGESWNPAHWDEIMLGDTVANLVRYVGSLSNNQVFNSSSVSGAHTSDALNNLKADIDGLEQTLDSKTAVDFSTATQGKYVSYPDGTVYNSADYQVLRHVILKKGQTIYVTTYATSSVAPLSLEISETVIQPLCQGANSASSFYYTATTQCQITVCTNYNNPYTCYIAGAFIGLTDGVNNLNDEVNNLNGAISTEATARENADTAIQNTLNTIGTILEGQSSPVTVASGTVVEISSITLPAGNWVMLGSFVFTPDFSQDANGYLMIGNTVILTVRGTGRNGGTFAPLASIVVGANNTTVTMKAYQASGADKTVGTISFRAIRIS